MNPDETPDVLWKPILGVREIILSVLSMLQDPNINSPANIDASVQFRDHPNEYK